MEIVENLRSVLLHQREVVYGTNEANFRLSAIIRSSYNTSSLTYVYEHVLVRVCSQYEIK